jgi:hypothetical protein
LRRGFLEDDEMNALAGFIAGLGLVATSVYAGEGPQFNSQSSVVSNQSSRLSSPIERGRYVAIMGGCNDCHTEGFGMRSGDVPERDWLKGDGTVGWRGPWGTTYPTNLRLSLSKMTEAQWVHYAKNLKARPPMPWFNVNKWSEADLRAFYQYVRHLGPAGQPVPQALPPGQQAKTPVISFPEPPEKPHAARGVTGG